MGIHDSESYGIKKDIPLLELSQFLDTYSCYHE